MNQKALLSMEIIRRIENQNASTKASTQTEKNAINETENDEPLVTDNPVIKEPIYFKLFECGKDILNRLDATCERAFMTTSRE